MGAAIAFQAANRQGKAWQMHDKMFANNTALDRPDLEKYAKEIFGLDAAKFAKDMDDPTVKAEVLADQKLGTSLGASGTPTFFVNGHQIVGAQAFDKFKVLIDDEIKKVDELLKAGTPLSAVYKKRSE